MPQEQFAAALRGDTERGFLELLGRCRPELRAAVEDAMTIAPGERAAVPTGLFVAIPEGYEAQVRPRSGLAFRQGLTVVNAPGRIDSDYRGEIQVLVVNLGDEPVVVKRGDRIAQMVLAPVIRLPAPAAGARCSSAADTGGSCTAVSCTPPTTAWSSPRRSKRSRR